MIFVTFIMFHPNHNTMKNMLRAFSILCLLVFSASKISAQKLYQPFDKYNSAVKNHNYISPKLLEDTKKRIQIQSDYYAYEHENGFISIGDHDRVSVVIYNAKGKWVETHIYSHFLNLGKTESDKIKENLKNTLQKSGYKADVYGDDYYYTKITNKKGSWYELHAIPLADAQKWGIAIVSDTFKFISFTPQ